MTLYNSGPKVLVEQTDWKVRRRAARGKQSGRTGDHRFPGDEVRADVDRKKDLDGEKRMKLGECGHVSYSSTLAGTTAIESLRTEPTLTYHSASTQVRPEPCDAARSAGPDSQ